MDKLKDAEVIKTADEYVENLRKTYPETIGKQITDRYLEIKKAGGSRKLQAAKLREMISKGVLNFAKADKEGRGDPLKLLTKKQLKEGEVWPQALESVEDTNEVKYKEAIDTYKIKKSAIIDTARILERKNPSTPKKFLILKAMEILTGIEKQKEGTK